MLSIVIPMAGSGRRFAEAGYEQPKPYIDVAGKWMIERVLDCLRPIEAHRVILLTKDRVGETSGAVETLLAAAGDVGDGEVLVANCDQLIDTPIDDFLAHARHADASVMTFNSTNPHHSYVKVDRDGYVDEIAEKRVISDNAVLGVYYFASGSSLMGAARGVLESESAKVNGEFYISAIINEYLIGTQPVSAYEVDVKDKHMLGTPEELRIFLDKVADGRVVL